MGWNSSLVLDGAGKPVISYYDELSDELKVLHCGNADCTDGSISAVPDRGLGATIGAWDIPSLALDAAGNPVIAYRDNNHGDLKVLHCGDSNCLTGNSIATPDSDTSGLFTVSSSSWSLALDAAGNPVVSYLDNGQLRVLHCGNQDCTLGNSIAIAETHLLGYSSSNTSLKLDGAGNPVVIFQSARFDNATYDYPLEVLHCRNANCTSGRSFAIIDYFGSRSYASLALDPADNPIVGFTDASTGDLRVLHCGNADCSVGNGITTPDSGTGGSNPAFVGPPSLALDSAGKPVISYPDSKDTLKVLHCGDSTCAAGNVITAPDPAIDVGMSSSIVLDTAGNPVVSYSDDDLGHLKVLHCADSVCRAPSRGSGDVDCDRHVSSIDATILLQYSAAFLRSLRCPSAADTNLDSQINATDAALIFQYEAGLISHLPP